MPEVLTDLEVEAIEKLIRAAIRWTGTGPNAKAVSSFNLLMADYKRLRKQE